MQRANGRLNEIIRKRKRGRTIYWQIDIKEDMWIQSNHLKDFTYFSMFHHKNKRTREIEIKRQYDFFHTFL